jgi:DNA polymerase-3 subunit beta
MKFSCEKILLQGAVGTVSRVVPSRTSVPALAGVLVSASGDEVVLTGYDLQTGIRSKVEAEIREDGAVVLGAKLLGDILRRLPDDILVVSTTDATASLTCGNAAYEIPVIPADDYPSLPEVSEEHSLLIQQGRLKAMLAQTGFAVFAINVSKPVMTGSLFETVAQRLTVVGVDGYRMAVRRESLEADAGACSFVAPGAALREVERICGDTEDIVRIGCAPRHVCFDFGSSLLISRRLEGDFPDYNAFLPKDSPIRLTVNAQALREAIERVGVMVDDKQKSPVRCVFGKDHVVLTTKTGRGEARDVCRLAGDGGGLEIGFNHRYLMEALKYAPAEDVRLELNKAISPCVIEPVDAGEKFSYLVLPVRLK